MHTLHWWAVEAVDKEDAVGIISSTLLESNYVEWSDWHVVGGGRWSDSQYEDSSDMVISYDEDSHKFKYTISQCLDERRNEMLHIKSRIDINQFLQHIEQYANVGNVGKDRFDLNDYYVRKASTLMLEYYNPDSYFYDFINHTASSDYIYERLDKKGGSGLFLVPIDFHY